MKIILVGNGPSATDRLHGSLIDSFDCVARFNNFILNGYQDWIGHRTDLHVVNEGRLFGGVADRGLPILMAVPWTKATQPCLWSRMDYLMPPEWGLISEEVARAFDRCAKQWPSTGLLALLHFISLDHDVWITGFDCFQSESHHYGDDGQFCGSHDGETEAWSIGGMVGSGLCHVL